MKRLIDVIVSVAALLLLAPVFAVVALMVRWKLGRPIVFRQLRPGLHGEPFWLIKFRSMHELCESASAPRSDADRLDDFGRRLRSTSLDELPELWNVLRGDMSLVGPRPLLMEYLPLYSPRQARRHEVRPGLTGWAQVHGRNATSWRARLELDVWYVDNHSLWIDLVVIWQTIWLVLSRSGTQHTGHATMPPFRGRQDD